MADPTVASPPPNLTMDPKRMSTNERDKIQSKVQQFIERAKPDVFLNLTAGKIATGTIEATSFNLVNAESQRVATLSTTDTGEPGLALFHPGEDRARAELLLAPDGPVLRFNDPKGRLSIQIKAFADSANVVLGDSSGRPRVVLLVDHGRPHIGMLPPGHRKRHVVIGTPFNKLPPTARVTRAWSRAVRAAQANRRQRFDRAALDAGFLSTELPTLWTFTRRRVKAARRRPARKAVA